MKKVVIGILLVCVIVVILFTTWYKRNLQTLSEIQKFNQEFEVYLEKEITGVDITTVMNRATENNNQYEIAKNKDGTYQEDEKYSIEILVQPTKERKILSNGSLRKSRDERFYEKLWWKYF